MTLRTLGGGLDILWAPRPVVRRLSVPESGAASDVTDAGWWFGHPLGPSTGCAVVVRAEWGRLRMGFAPGG